jgi:biotin carboxylase
VATNNRPVTILCLATEHKGDPFIRECKRQGATVLVITEEKVAHKPWPMDSIDERFLMPDLSQRQDVTHAVAYLARTRRIDRIIALDDYDVGTAAALREHMRLPGMGETMARYFRDKLAMRAKAAASGIPVPAFTPLLNMAAIRRFTEQTRPPWVLKPRFEAGAIGIQRIHSQDELWPALDSLGDRLSYYLLEKFLPGNVYHVDALITDRTVRFAISSGYGRPPLNVSHEGGVFTTRILPRGGEEDSRLQERLRQMIASTGFVQGVVHTEFIRANEDGDYYFLETGSRVGGANIADLVEHAAGLNLWAEWARIEVSQARGELYELPPLREDYSGLLVCLARQPHPDLSAYNDPEVAWRLDKEYHAGLIVASPDSDRVQALLSDYANRFVRDFLDVQPPKEATRTQT